MGVPHKKKRFVLKSPQKRSLQLWHLVVAQPAPLTGKTILRQFFFSIDVPKNVSPLYSASLEVIVAKVPYRQTECHKYLTT